MIIKHKYTPCLTATEKGGSIFYIYKINKHDFPNSHLLTFAYPIMHISMCYTVIWSYIYIHTYFFLTHSNSNESGAFAIVSNISTAKPKAKYYNKKRK